MSERRQEKSLLSLWTSSQQNMLASWLDLVQGTQKLSRAVAWNETVTAWRRAMQETLAAQAAWLRTWTGRVQVTTGSPTELRKNVQEVQVLLLGWTEAQQRLWEGWFDLVAQLGPLLEADSQPDEHLISHLRENGQAIIKVQEEWLRRWTANLPNQEG